MQGDDAWLKGMRRLGWEFAAAIIFILILGGRKSKGKMVNIYIPYHFRHRRFVMTRL